MGYWPKIRNFYNYNWSFSETLILCTSCPDVLAWLVNGSGDSLLGAEAGKGGLLIAWGLGGGPEGGSKKPSSEYGLNRPE